MTIFAAKERRSVAVRSTGYSNRRSFGMTSGSQRAEVRQILQTPTVQRQQTSGQPVYLCSKALDTSPLGSHAFFRIGGASVGNKTLSLGPHDQGSDCWQGVKGINYPSDYNAAGNCQKTNIKESKLMTEYSAYPLGKYCTWGPNSNTFVGHMARQCGLASPDPTGWTPGIDDSPPQTNTYAPDKWATLSGCETKACYKDSSGKVRAPIGLTPAITQNRTDPVDRTVTTQKGLVWATDHKGVRYLTLVSITNSSTQRGTRIIFISFIDKDSKPMAIKQALKYQPRGIQKLDWKYIQSIPGKVPATTAIK